MNIDIGLISVAPAERFVLAVALDVCADLLIAAYADDSDLGARTIKALAEDPALLAMHAAILTSTFRSYGLTPQRLHEAAAGLREWHDPRGTDHNGKDNESGN